MAPMFAYYMRLAAISVRQNPIMSALMVCAIALGVGACMTAVNILYLLAKDPIPAKSDVLYAVQLDSWDPNRPYSADGDPPPQLTYLDASALMTAQLGSEPPAPRQAAMVRTGFVVEPAGEEARPFDTSGRATYADFFPMFDVPFLFGGAWDAQADRDGEQVAVLAKGFNERLFGGEDSVGRSVRLSGRTYRVAGVLDDWRPLPKFYDMNNNAIEPPADIFVPFSLVATLGLPRHGNTNCWKPVAGAGLAAFLASECVWIQFWAELRNEEQKNRYLTFLSNYAEEQKQLGRFERPLNNRIRDVNEWIEDHDMGTDLAAMMVAIGAMFLAVCLLNTVGLLLAKFLGKAPEVGLRRTLGASKRTLFCQYLVEAGCIGLMGGALGVGVTWLALRGVGAAFDELLGDLVAFNGTVLMFTIGLAIASSLAAALYPTWRACGVQPAAQLKAQ